MASIVSYQTWDGGEGWNCPTVLIGYCIESPLDVLKRVLLTHNVHHYLGLYRPIDYNYPNNKKTQDKYWELIDGIIKVANETL